MKFACGALDEIRGNFFSILFKLSSNILTFLASLLENMNFNRMKTAFTFMVIFIYSPASYLIINRDEIRREALNFAARYTCTYLDIYRRTHTLIISIILNANKSG